MPLAGHGGKGVCTPSVCTVRLWDHEGTYDMAKKQDATNGAPYRYGFP